MFKKILVANRGEIAVRVIRAAREMGIKTVAIYSDLDRDSLHVRYADESYALGGSTAQETYSNIRKIIAAATELGVDAIHPGYGFLSENPTFADICNLWDMRFIGPRGEAMRRIGIKSMARETMLKAGVPVVPGSDGAVPGEGQALEVADAVGFPVVIKAAAGGGGKGIRLARDREELLTVFPRVKREAAAAFGNGDVYVEKFIVDPRHIEIQVLADEKGTLVHLGERESSIQRRRQKILEETPSTALNTELRKRMSEAAVKAAQAVGYTNAGTVEFLLDAERNFYFMEMNARIQVEHTVTEMVTGIDLVKEQIRIAAGESLGYRQSDIRNRGWAMECRINAEDPERGLLPSPGRIEVYEAPGGPGVRLDSSAFAGCEIPPHYDSMFAKLVVLAENRPAAIARMERALKEFRVEGIKTSIPVHLKILAHPLFQKGDYDINFLERHVLKERQKEGEEKAS
ncbi:MAG: acetyl-CoA carboxylase biotin carboxylase subunit [Firmicutes bacterium]|nr:acetyl-CoA carboxylase biotin carboxylase subunit [Bacillota bacterium]MCL5039099.1 acetyl-CoA carboxylase biotin carboxylase subunit [Bacillota bacterium]